MYVQVYGAPAKYVRIVESYRDENKCIKKRVIQNLGRLDKLLAEDPQALEKLKEQYAEERAAKQELTASSRIRDVAQILSVSEDDRSGDALPFPELLYGHYPLLALWKKDLAMKRKLDYMQTGRSMEFDLNNAISYLVCRKALDPASVRFTFNTKDDFLGAPAKDCGLHQLYSCYDFLSENKDSLFKWVNAKMDKLYGENRATLVFYDVTNTYFEAPLTDAERDYERVDFAEKLADLLDEWQEDHELPDKCFDEDGNVIASELPAEFLERLADEKVQYLRMRGPSKEHRSDLPLVSIALVIDESGFPMDFQLYAGNASEFKTMRASIESLKEKYGIRQAVVVADRGLNSVANLKMLKEMKFGYLVAQKVTQFSDKLQKQMFDLASYTTLNPKDPDGWRYKVIPKWTKSSAAGSVNCTLVITYDEKRRRRDEAILNAWVEIVKQKQAKGQKLGPRKSGWAALAKTESDKESPIIGINEEVLEKKRKFCGYAAIVYDVSSEQDEQPKLLKPTEIAYAYRHLTQIEDCFRIMKSNLGLRPMYVWNAKHIEGHIMVCVLALLLVRMLQRRLEANKTPLSINEICRALGRAHVGAIKSASATPNPNDGVFFVRVGRHPRWTEGKEDIKREALQALIEAEKSKADSMGKIMRAAGLTPLPRIVKLSELASCLGTRFDLPTDAIPETRWWAL